VNLTRRSSHRVNWIRLRLLAGTAFILGCVVAVGTKQIAASPAEDLASLTLVETLWDKRCAALTSGAPLDLNGNINNVRRRHPRCGAQGVGAHGIATLSN